MGSTFPGCPKYDGPTEWALIKDYSYLDDRESLDRKPPDNHGSPTSAHIEIDRLVILVLEGHDLAPAMSAHLLKCRRCRYAMVTEVSDQLQRWPRSILCETRQSLLSEWQEAAKAYAFILEELTEGVGKVPDSDLFKLAKVTEITRRMTAQSRAELDQHIAEHRC